MDLKELKVGELLELINVLNLNKKVEPKKECGGYRIVVLQRGWVAVGMFFKEGEHCFLEKAATIRIWGTSGKPGLSYLAENGPTEDTVLDKTPYPIRFHELTIVHMYDCKDSSWENIL